MQMKETSVAAAIASVGLNIHKGKDKIPKHNMKNTNPITLNEALEDVETFTYLGGIINKQGASDADMEARIDKARGTFLQLNNIWNSKQLSTNTKVRIFNTNIKSALPDGAETWRTTKTMIKRYKYF
ncbi:unnamed protein product [Schistosoma curassoni]|uniref:DUF6451 domain-containing protein n=1 Tax=Schistosoma curassoni TaxID=6186 RepID=A0A183JLW6_9TREM|nr:unnamed protein product [Schistosoma curassoni]